MFTWWGRTVYRGRWWVLLASAALVVTGIVWGTGVFGRLHGGGFDDPSSPSVQALERINAEFGSPTSDLIVLYSSETATVDDPAFADPVRRVLDRLAQREEVAQFRSYYTTQSPEFVSTDRHATYVAVYLRDGEDDAKLADVETLRPLLVADSPSVETLVGGNYAFLDDANRLVAADIVRAEVISLPVLLILMIFIFRGLVAAATPLLVGVTAILGAFTVTRVLTSFTEVSVFAVNVITMIGLAMAIDYALFIVSRFREELAAGHAVPVAIVRTVATAGRTVAVSGLTVAVALSSLLLFPMGFLKSMAYGGIAAVLVAMLAAVTMLPALLAILGPRINALRVPLPARRQGSGAAQGAWARLARSVMHRPVVYLVVVSIVLLALASPFLRVRFGGFDERVMPKDTQSRVVAERLASEFATGSVAPILVLLTNATQQGVESFVASAAALPHATGATVTAKSGSSWLVAITYDGESTSPEAHDLVTAVRELPAPQGAEVFVTGRPAGEMDQLASLRDHLPPMVLYVALVTFLLLFFAFGSVVLPLKAILLNAISVGASFGVVVWGFQDGHLADLLGFTVTGFLEPTNLVLMLAILFGLSTDYEVFLLSRVREEWDRRGNNTEAVAAGLQRTGGIITAAALLLIVVVAGFATGGTTSIKLLGVGTVVAVAVDAVLVRALLVPAAMRLLGRWNWWAPGPLARLYRRYGLSETEAPPAPAKELVASDVA